MLIAFPCIGFDNPCFRCKVVVGVVFWSRTVCSGRFSLLDAHFCELGLDELGVEFIVEPPWFCCLR